MGIVYLTIFTGWIGFSLPFPLFSHIFLNPEFGLIDPDTSQLTRTVILGIAIALYPIGQAIGAPILGRWSDRIGRKPSLVWSLCVTVVGSATMVAGVASGHVALVLFGRFVSGLGEGSIAIAQSLIADLSTEGTKARNFAYVGIAMDAGFIFGPLIGAALADPQVFQFSAPWFPFAVATVLFALNAVLVLVFLNSKPTIDSEQTIRRSIADTLRSPALTQQFLISFFVYWAIMTFFDFFPVYQVAVFQTSPMTLGIVAAAISVPLILSGLVVGPLINKLGSKWVNVASSVLMAIGMLLFVNTEYVPLLAVAVTVVCVGINFGQTATSVAVSDAATTSDQGNALGLYRSVTVIAAALSSLVGGVLAGIDPSYPFAFGVGACLLCVTLLLGLHPTLWRRLRVVGKT